MNHLAAFILRIVAGEVYQRQSGLRAIGFRPGHAIMDLLVSASGYDGGETPTVRIVAIDPAMARVNCAGGDA